MAGVRFFILVSFKLDQEVLHVSERRGILKAQLEKLHSKQPQFAKNPAAKTLFKSYTTASVKPNGSPKPKKVENDHTYDEGISSDESNSDDGEIIDFLSSNTEVGKGKRVMRDGAWAGETPSGVRSGSDETTDESSGGREVRSIIGREGGYGRRQKDG